MFDEVILSRESIATLARAVVHGAVTEDRVVDAGLVALEVGATGESSAAVVACERLSRPDELC